MPTDCLTKQMAQKLMTMNAWNFTTTVEYRSLVQSGSLQFSSVETATSTQHLLPRFLARQRHHLRQWSRSTFPHLLHQAHKFLHLQGHQRPGLWTQVWNLQTKDGLIPPRIIRRQKNYKRGKHTEAFIDGKHST